MRLVRRSSLCAQGRFMRSSFSALAASGLLMLSGATAILGNEATAAAALISSYRASQGLGPVVVDPRLNQLAAYQARSIAAAGQLSHGHFASRLAQAGIYTGAENLSMGPAVRWSCDCPLEGVPGAQRKPADAFGPTHRPCSIWPVLGARAEPVSSDKANEHRASTSPATAAELNGSQALALSF
jgi:hypothetical protein